MPIVPRHLYLVNCFQEGMLKFDYRIGSVSADFRPFQVGGEEKKRKKDTKMTRRVNPNSHGGGRVVPWCWVTFQCRGVLQFGLQ